MLGFKVNLIKPRLSRCGPHLDVVKVQLDGVSQEEHLPSNAGQIGSTGSGGGTDKLKASGSRHTPEHLSSMEKKSELRHGSHDQDQEGEADAEFH
jgi:hypothetical protein